MASARIAAFVARRKLAALSEARVRLLAAYDGLEADADALPPREALGALSAGLAALRSGDEAVHPEVANLEVALGDPHVDPGPWLVRLRRSIRQGRARADAMAAYGGALGEWLAPQRRRHQPSPDEAAALRARWDAAGPAPKLRSFSRKRLRTQLSVSTGAPRGPAAASAGRFRRSSAQFGSRARIRRAAPQLWASVHARLDPEKVAAARAAVAEACGRLLQHVDSPLRPPPAVLTPAGRADAGSIRWTQHDDPGALEFFAAFRLAWAELAQWDWPPRAGVGLAPFWAGQRFRLRPRLDFLSGCTVEALGDALAAALAPWSGRARLVRLVRLARLQELNAPQILVDNERSLLAQRPDPLGVCPEAEALVGVGWHRANAALPPDDGSDYAYGRQATLAALVWADVQVAQHTGRPLHVFKTDLRDFYPSVSHTLIDELLDGVGVPPELRTVVGRALSVPAGAARTTRGLPLGLSLSRALGELVVDVLLGEALAAGGGRVRAHVLVDDLVLVSEDAPALAAAREALGRAVAAAGLALNEEKTGSFAVNAAPPPGDGPVLWGLLELHDTGWVLAEAPMQALLDATRAHVEAHAALLDRVAAWRAQVGYAWTLLAPAARLGPAHLETVRSALERLRTLPLRAADGAVQPGIAALVRHELQARFLGEGGGAEVPDAWLHWPITAGGLGLAYPLAELVPLVLAEERAEPVPVPAGPYAETDPAWVAWYAHQLAPLEPVLPTASAADPLVERFVARGVQLGQRPGALSTRWRWVLATFGPDMLDAFGSFAFVAPDLVPVSLIRESLTGGRRASRAPAGGDEDVPF